MKMTNLQQIENLINSVSKCPEMSDNSLAEIFEDFAIKYAVYNYKQCINEITQTGSTLIDSKTRFHQWINNDE